MHAVLRRAPVPPICRKAGIHVHTHPPRHCPPGCPQSQSQSQLELSSVSFGHTSALLANMHNMCEMHACMHTCMSMYMYMHSHIDIPTHVHTCTCISNQVHPCEHAQMHTCMDAYTHTCICMGSRYVQVCKALAIHGCVCVCVLGHVDKHRCR